MCEYWDVYDENKIKTGKKHKRGIPLLEGEYHLIVHVVLKNKDGRYLITKRCACKKHAFKWEYTGGSVIEGETSYEAAVREVYEEVGIDLSLVKGEIILSYRDGYIFADIWEFELEFTEDDITLQKEEVEDFKIVTKNEIKEMIDNNLFLHHIKNTVDYI